MNQLLAMRAFIRVVESGSFRGAANQLLLPRSTVSKLVTDLEKHLGTRLMHRTTRHVAVTPEGEEYYRHAARLVAEIDEADGAVRGSKLTPRGHLRIESTATFAQNILIPHLPDFHAQYPHITIARHLFDAGFVTCASPAYLERMGTPAAPQELAGRHCKVGFFSHADGKAKPMLFVKPGDRFTVSELQFSANEDNGQIAMMLAGLGIGQNLRPFVQPYLESGQLVEILGEWSHPPLPFHVVYPPGRHQSARLKAFIQWLIERFGKVGVPPATLSGR